MIKNFEIKSIQQITVLSEPILKQGEHYKLSNQDNLLPATKNTHE